MKGNAAVVRGRRWISTGALALAVVLLAALTARLSAALSGAGPWQAVAAIPSARFDPAAALGSDGRLYALGGCPDQICKRSADFRVLAYQPRTNQWTAVAPVTTAHDSRAAVVGADSRIYALGGHGKSVEAFDPRTARWAAVAPLSVPRDGVAVAAGPDGRIYAIGGCCDSGGRPLSSAEAFDPGRNVWTVVAPLRAPRRDAAAALGPDGRIYVIGGCCDQRGQPLDSVEAYDPGSDRWSQAPPLPAARTALAAVTASDGRIYALGGEQSCCLGLHHWSTSSTAVTAYDPRTQAWAAAPSMRTPRSHLGAVLGPDGRIYAIGGLDDAALAGRGASLDTVEAYTPDGRTSSVPAWLWILSSGIVMVLAAGAATLTWLRPSVSAVGDA